MRTTILTSLAAAALFTLPAMAASDDQASGQQANKSGSNQQGSQIQAMTQSELRGSLEQAGFTDITVLDATYLVQAKTAKGDEVTMFINPPADMAGENAAGGSQAGSGGDASGQAQTTSKSE
ncbi:MAG TPA: hypothetical protein VHL31_21275 [Geminicoccus sp.]|jgi:hypothetical protein|uniref:hypothetical protein n=1 Tax=Geminicoccus sp. TaxID=2024832 RepID=UPI002E337E75|nr:hypothetical protein [Geminicoccus sp.]HEX2528811.1 hypothetical protein [Geminicoccus sp.]